MAAEKEGHIPPSDSVLFILVCFSIGMLIRLGLKWTKIPYTAMLLVRADALWLHAVCAHVTSRSAYVLLSAASCCCSFLALQLVSCSWPTLPHRHSPTPCSCGW